jgi:hypothetical protein
MGAAAKAERHEGRALSTEQAASYALYEVLDITIEAPEPAANSRLPHRGDDSESADGTRDSERCLPLVLHVAVFELMATMRAMRRLRPDPVPDELLERLIEADGP